MLLGSQLGTGSASQADAIGIEDSDVEYDTEREDGPDEDDDELARGQETGALTEPLDDGIAAHATARAGALRPGFPSRIFRPPIA